MIQNVFNTPGLCVISGNIRERTLPQTPYKRHVQKMQTSAERKAALIKPSKNSISIGLQESEDRSRAIRGRRIGV